MQSRELTYRGQESKTCMHQNSKSAIRLSELRPKPVVSTYWRGPSDALVGWRPAGSDVNTDTPPGLPPVSARLSPASPTSRVLILIVVFCALMAPQIAQATTADRIDGGATQLACDLPASLATPGGRVLHTDRPPSPINMMDDRYWGLSAAVTGYRATGVPLVALSSGVIGPGGGIDDIGIYYFIPKLSVATGWTLNRSIVAFYAILLGAAFCLGTAGFLLYFGAFASRLIAVLALAGLTVIVYKLGDVYTAQFAVPVSVIPWALLLVRCKNRVLPVFFLASGILIGVANYIRAQSGTAVLFALLALAVFQFHGTKKGKLLLLACLIVGLLTPRVFFQRAVTRRDAFIRTQCPSYAAISVGHPLWHPVYLGFGYLQNNVGIAWNDIVAWKRVQAIAPGTLYGSTEYERILRHEVFTLLRRQPLFVFMTLASKAGVILCFILMFANLGLPAALLWPKPWPIELSFWAAIAFSAIPGLLVMPLPVYMVGLFSVATLYGVVSLGFALRADGHEPGDNIPLQVQP